jgi:hypothetical protein
MSTDKTRKGNKMKPATKKGRAKVVNKPAHVRGTTKTEQAPAEKTPQSFCGVHSDI